MIKSNSFKSNKFNRNGMNTPKFINLRDVFNISNYF